MTRGLPILPRAPAAAAGCLAAVLQMSGALKTTPLLDALPFDITTASLALLLPALALLAATRRWVVAAPLALPLAAAALLWLWLVLAGSWTASRLVVEAKLPEIALAAPAMLAAGMLVGAEDTARRAFCRGCLGIGLLLAAIIAWGASAGWLALARDLARTSVHHQLAGLALATAAALAAVAAVEVRAWPLRLGCCLMVLALALAALLPGGRTALVALLAGVALAPALRLRRGAGLVWVLGVLAAMGLGGAWLLLHPELAEGLRTLERLTAEPAGLEARRALWAEALRWGGEAAPFGLGTGGFGIAAGHGEWRGRYPHNAGGTGRGRAAGAAALARGLRRRRTGGGAAGAPGAAGAAGAHRGAGAAGRADHHGLDRSRQPHGLVRPRPGAQPRPPGAGPAGARGLGRAGCGACMNASASARSTWRRRWCCCRCWRRSSRWWRWRSGCGSGDRCCSCSRAPGEAGSPSPC
jgi:hypothetical protein